MEQKLQLSIFMLLIQVSLAVWQRVTVKKGETVHLNCPVSNPHQTSVDWKNPEGYIMFFKHNKVSAGLKDERYSINKLPESEFSISISNVTFKDGGNYTCTQYGNHVIQKTVEVTVLGHPKITRITHKGRFDIKCTAEGNHYSPQIFWKLDHGPEILAHPQFLHEGKKYVSMAMLGVQSVEKKVIVKCLVRHPALHSQTLMNFVKIGRNSKSHYTTMTSSPTAQPQRSAEVQRTTTGWYRHGGTKVYLTTRDVNGLSSESSMKLSASPSTQTFSSTELKTVTAPPGFPLDSVTSTGSHLSTRDNSRTSGMWNDTISNATGWTTEEIESYNRTEGNTTGRFNNPNMRTGTEGSSDLLVVLVTCLILGLLVVVIFFAIKLRRAHIIWKKENEDSDPSEESSKSKSSQEEKNSQGQRRRGLFNMAFTQYVPEEPPVMISVINTAAMTAAENVNIEQTSQTHTPGQSSAKCDIKETEL